MKNSLNALIHKTGGHKMEKIYKTLDELFEINNRYSLSTEVINKLRSDMQTAKVCTPVIGKFSSGKSALLNTLLGYTKGKKILKVDITPETAVPAEISYAPVEENICIIQNDGTHRKVSVDEYRELELDANTVYCTSINLKNSFLEEIPDVMLVDMPGFESGFEVHNRAIDSYLPRSLAYIIAFPADDMTLRTSVGNILKELCLHDMPICIAITKYDKRNDDYPNTLSALKENLKKFIGKRELIYCETSSYTGDAEELKKFLKIIQENSQQILADKFKNAVLAAINTTENYLHTTLKSSELSESELDEQKEKLGKQLDTLNNQFSNEKENFDAAISECVEEIKGDVQIALEAEESSFVAMAMNNQNINERMNIVVRNAVTTSIKKRFIPKVEKYLKRVANCINNESIGDVHVLFSFNAEEVSKGIVSMSVATTAAIILGLPVIGALVVGVIALYHKIKGDQKREEQKRQIRMKLNSEVYPQVLKEVGHGIETAITKQIKLINTSIEDEITAQRNALEQAMEDVRKKISDEKEAKENLAVDIKADLAKIDEMKINLA